MYLVAGLGNPGDNYKMTRHNIGFETIDYIDAKEDVIPFIKDVHSLDLWNKDFFVSITNDMQ